MEQNINLPATYQAEPEYHAPAPAPASYFTDMAAFEGAQRVAKMLAASDMVPKQYQNNVANTVLALEVALQTKSSPFFVMQNLNVIQGKPGWNAQFIAALLNASGRFRGGLRYETDDDDNPTRCRVWAVEAATGERLNGPTVTLEMARKEGWTNRPGSKWQTMPEVMLGYRAVTFFGRRFAPDLLLGMRTDDELDDIGELPQPRSARQPPRGGGLEAAAEAVPASGAAAINALLEGDAPTTCHSERSEESPAEIERPRQEAGDASSPAAPQHDRNDGDGKAEPPEGETPAEADAGLPENLKRYLEAKEGKKPRRPAEPQQQTLPAGEPEEIAEYRAAARKCMDEIDGIDDPEALKNWWQRRDYKRLTDELGGMNSEWHRAVAEHVQGRIRELEAKR